MREQAAEPDSHHVLSCTDARLLRQRQLYAIAHLVLGLLLTLTQVFLVPVLVQMVLVGPAS